MPPTSKATQTVMANEVTFIVVPPDCAQLAPGETMRADALPLLGKVAFGVMEILEKPEPIRKPDGSAE